MHRSSASRPRTTLAVAALLAAAVLAAACGARGGENVTDAAEINGNPQGAPTTAAPATPAAAPSRVRRVSVDAMRASVPPPGAR